MRHTPALLYDGDCPFCKRWIKEWQSITGDKIHYLPYQSVLLDYPEVDLDNCRKSVQLILPNGALLSGAHAVFKLLSLGGQRRYWLWLYEHIPFFAPISECIYRLIARHRLFFSRFI